MPAFKPKHPLQRLALSVIAGVLSAHFYVKADRHFPPSTSSQQSLTLPANPPAGPPTTPELIQSSTPVAADGKKAPTVRDRLVSLGNHQRIEDLLAVIQKLPTGEDRDWGSEFLARRWFPLDEAGALRWIESLPDGTQKTQAYCGMISSWSKENSDMASAWIAGLPEGALKTASAAALSNTLISLDPGASLSWAIVSLQTMQGADHLSLQINHLAGHDYAAAERILTVSDLPEEEKRLALANARAAWNQEQVLNGKWHKILPPAPVAP